MGSGSPTSLPQIAGGTTFLQPGGAGVVTTLSAPYTSAPFLALPRAEQVIREVLDISSIGGVPTPAVSGNVLITSSSQSGAAKWVLPTTYSAVHLDGQFGVVVAPGSTQSIDDQPLGSGVGGVLVVVEGPVLALCVAPTAGGAIALGTMLTSDGNGNLEPFQLPAAAPTPTVTPVGTTGGTTDSYALVAVSVSGTYSAIGTAGTSTTSNATLTNANYNQITWTPVADAAGYIIIRTVASGTPSTTGAIGFAPAGTSVFNDTGLAVQPNTTATQPFPTLPAGGTPTVVQITGALAGSTTWSYKIAAIAPNGVWGAAGTAGSVTTGNGTLSIANANKITWTPTAGASSYAIQRSAAGGTPSTTGYIGLASTAMATNGFIDYGIAATTYTQNVTPTPTPQAGTALARALGTLSSGTTTPTLVAVNVGCL
jgi:hypothetical protein